MTVLDNATFRIATESDAAALSHFGFRSFRAAFEHLYSETALVTFLQKSRSEQCYRTFASNAAHRLVVAENTSREIVGYVLCGPLSLPVNAAPERALELKHLYVDPAYQSLGIGIKLTTLIIDFARSQRAHSLFLGVYSENFGAQRFYERAGFAKVGSYNFHVGDHIDHEYIFELRLQ